MAEEKAEIGVTAGGVVMVGLPCQQDDAWLTETTRILLRGTFAAVIRQYER